MSVVGMAMFSKINSYYQAKSALKKYCIFFAILGLISIALSFFLKNAFWDGIFFLVLSAFIYFTWSRTAAIIMLINTFAGIIITILNKFGISEGGGNLFLAIASFVISIEITIIVFSSRRNFADEISNENNSLKRYWSGKISLPIVFWIFTIIPSVFFISAATYDSMLPSHTAQSFKAIIEGFEGGILIFLFFNFIPLWRSSSNYRGASLWSYSAKGAIFIYIISFSILIGFGLVSSIQEGNSQQTTDVLDEAVSGYIKEYNTHLPQKVDNKTILLSVTKIKRNIIYLYKLNIDKSSFAINNQIISKIKKSQAQQLCSHDSTSLEILSQGYTYIYKYNDFNGKEILSYSVGVKDCLMLKDAQNNMQRF